MSKVKIKSEYKVGDKVRILNNGGYNWITPAINIHGKSGIYGVVQRIGNNRAVDLKLFTKDDKELQADEKQRDGMDLDWTFFPEDIKPYFARQIQALVVRDLRTNEIVTFIPIASMYSEVFFSIKLHDYCSSIDEVLKAFQLTSKVFRDYIKSCWEVESAPFCIEGKALNLTGFGHLGIGIESKEVEWK
jgi:hypothetical protein